jgi:hypothetical protein
MKRDFEADRTYSSIDNPTAAYPRDKMAGFFDSEDSEPAMATEPVRSPTPPAEVAPAQEGVSLVYLGLALVGGGLLAVGVSGILALLLLSA